MTRLVVVGASLAGLRAVEAARKAGHDGPITLIGAEEHLPYDRPPLSKEWLEPGDDPGPTTFHSEDHLADLGVELRLGTPATGLDTGSRRVLIDDASVAYDALIVATGAQARTLSGTEGLDGVHALRTVDDARAIRAALLAGARTVVIGAGFIGSEVASGAAKHGVEVTIVEAQGTPLVRAIGAPMGAAIARLHERNGTSLLTGTGVRAVTGTDHVEKVELEDGTTLGADLVVVGIGATPSTDWLEGSALTLDDGVVCDENLSTGVDGVWAAGDVARWHNPLFDRHQRLEHWTSAAEQGAAAARNALGQAKAYSTVPYFWSDWYGSRIQFVGITDADEVQMVEGDPTEPGRWVALYRRGDLLGGALAVDGQSVIMKYRAQIAKRTTWQDALDFAAARRAKA